MIITDCWPWLISDWEPIVKKLLCLNRECLVCVIDVPLWKLRICESLRKIRPSQHSRANIEARGNVCVIFTHWKPVSPVPSSQDHHLDITSRIGFAFTRMYLCFCSFYYFWFSSATRFAFFTILKETKSQISFNLSPTSFSGFTPLPITWFGFLLSIMNFRHWKNAWFWFSTLSPYLGQHHHCPIKRCSNNAATLNIIHLLQSLNVCNRVPHTGNPYSIMDHNTPARSNLR